MIDVKQEIIAYESYLTLKNYKGSTVKMYCRTLNHFYRYKAQNYDGELLSQKQAEGYLLQRVKQGKSWSTINVDYSALRKYYKVMRDYEWNLKKLPRPKRDKKLPSIVSKEEVARMISAAPTLKYQTFITLLYCTGMRLSEATNLRLTDVDSDRMQISIKEGKGGKDRMIQMPEKLLGVLRIYYKVYRPVEYLFNGIKKGRKYSQSGAQWSIRRARFLAGITKKCSIHTLRNCYATHHLELGTDLVYLQEQLGHKNLKTTAKYIRLCIERYRQINHPIDVITIKFRITTG